MEKSDFAGKTGSQQECRGKCTRFKFLMSKDRNEFEFNVKADSYYKSCITASLILR